MGITSYAGIYEILEVFFFFSLFIFTLQYKDIFFVVVCKVNSLETHNIGISKTFAEKTLGLVKDIR